MRSAHQEALQKDLQTFLVLFTCIPVQEMDITYQALLGLVGKIASLIAEITANRFWEALSD